MSRAEVLQLVAALLGAFATVVSAAEQRLVKRLRGAGANDPDHAIQLPGLSPLPRWRLSRLLGAGAIDRIGPGVYYLDEQGYRAFRRSRKIRALIVVAIGLAVAGVLYLTR